MRPADPWHRPRSRPGAVAFNYVVRGGQRVRKDTKTHQDRWLAIDPDSCAQIANHLDEITGALAAVASGYAMATVLQRPGACPAVEPGLGYPPDRRSRRYRRGGVRHQGRPALHRQPAPRRRLRLAQHRRAPRPQRRRRDHAAALRRPGPRGGQASRRIPRTTDRQIYPVISSALTLSCKRVRAGCHLGAATRCRRPARIAPNIRHSVPFLRGRQPARGHFRWRPTFSRQCAIAVWRIPRRAGLSSLAASRRAGEEQPLPGVGEVVAELLG